jgi:hypothetical protein
LEEYTINFIKFYCCKIVLVKGGNLMKNIFTIVGVILMLSFVFAIGGQEELSPVRVYDAGNFENAGNVDGLGVSGAAGQGAGEPMLISAGPGEGEMIRLMEGVHVGANGEQMMVRTEANNQMRLEVGGKAAKSSMAIDQETIDGQTKLSTKLSNGQNAEIKVMPDKASETALSRLRLKNCVEADGCSIELKEVGEGDGAKLAYEVKTQRRSKFLGLFSAEMNVSAQVNAETGEVMNVNKPWWAFMASEPTEE